MNGFVKSRIGDDIEYTLENNPSVSVIRGCACSSQCSESWVVKVDDVPAIYFRYFRRALESAEKLGASDDV